MQSLLMRFVAMSLFAASAMNDEVLFDPACTFDGPIKLWMRISDPTLSWRTPTLPVGKPMSFTLAFESYEAAARAGGALTSSFEKFCSDYQKLQWSPAECAADLRRQVTTSSLELSHLDTS